MHAAQGDTDDEDRRWSIKDDREREKSRGMRKKERGEDTEVTWAEWSI